MRLNEKQFAELRAVAAPLVKWLNDNCHPHVVAIVDPMRVQLLEGIASQPIEEFIKD
jgi:hypothetical protein